MDRLWDVPGHLMPTAYLAPGEFPAMTSAYEIVSRLGDLAALGFGFCVAVLLVVGTAAFMQRDRV